MRFPNLLAFLGLVVVIAHSAQIHIPQAGIARFADGYLHNVWGISSNLIVGPPSLGKADVAAFSNAAGLVSSGGVIRLLDMNGKMIGEYESLEKQPILNIESSSSTAVVWLPSKRLLLRWRGNSFMSTPIDDSSFSGKVMFLRLASDETAEFFVLLADLSVAKASVALPTGRLVSIDIQPGAKGNVFVSHSWLVWQDEHGLTLERSNGEKKSILLSKDFLPQGDLEIERMSTDWWHVASGLTGTNWAIHLTATTAVGSLLPPPSSEVNQ